MSNSDRVKIRTAPRPANPAPKTLEALASELAGLPVLVQHRPPNSPALSSHAMRQLQQTIGNQAVSRTLPLGVANSLAKRTTQGPAHRAPGVRSAVVMRRIDPDFVTYRGPAAGPATKPEMQAFYHQFVAAEVARFSARPIDDDAKQAMQTADLYFRLFMLNSQAPNEIFRKLNSLIAAVNAAADLWDAQLGLPGAAPGSEVSWRTERRRREEARHVAGVTKPMPLRGVDSRLEAQQLLANLQAALNGALGPGFALGQVGVRGSAVTGVRSRNQQPFEQGTGAYQETSDASDLDFFFTSPALEARIVATNHLLGDRGLNAGGTLNAQYLSRWLTNCPAPGNGYAHAIALDAALDGFSSHARARTGRKCDVTFIGNPTRGVLANDPGTLIL